MRESMNSEKADMTANGYFVTKEGWFVASSFEDEADSICSNADIGAPNTLK